MNSTSVATPLMPAVRPAEALTPGSVAVSDRWIANPVRVVTIARQHGTGGESIAESIAQELGFTLVDYDIIKRAAEQARTSPDVIEGATRHRNFLTRILAVMGEAGAGSSAPWVTPIALQASPLFTSGDYRALVEQAIRDLAAQGGVVIVGHGAQLVLADRSDVLRVLVSGSVERRADRARAAGMSPDDAEQAIRKADNERIAYFREFYDAGWLDPSTYDLIMNTDRMRLDDASELVVRAVRARDRSVPEPAGGG